MIDSRLVRRLVEAMGERGRVVWHIELHRALMEVLR